MKREDRKGRKEDQELVYWDCFMQNRVSLRVLGLLLGYLKQLGRACDVGSTSLKLKCGANKIEDRATPGLSNETFVRLLP